MTIEIISEEFGVFVDSWANSADRMKEAFVRLKDHLAKKTDIEFAFKARPGVTYSLRAKHTKQKDRDLFVMLDVIDDTPDTRWLSICFYGDLITDEQEEGDLVPGGLAGDDGYCFDLDEWDESLICYIEKRLDEAWQHAGK